jgi:hypothetical protein
MLMSRHQTAGQNRDVKIANRSFENVSQFKYFGTTATNRNFIEKKIMKRLNYVNASYHSAEKLLSTYLLSKNLKTLINNTITCLLFWSLGL